MYAAYKSATEFTGAPTVILAHTIKGYFLGSHFAGRNATHQMKKLALDDLKQFRDRLQIPISDEVLEENPYQPPYFNPGPDDERVKYAMERRRALGGYLPERRNAPKQLKLPDDKAYQAVKKGSGNQPIATTLDVNAARLTVDFWRNVYTLNYEVLRLPNGNAAGLTEPSVSLWTPCDQGQTC